MSKHAHCFMVNKIDPVDRAVIQSSAATYMRGGMDERAAHIKAAEDALNHLLDQKARIERETLASFEKAYPDAYRRLTGNQETIDVAKTTPEADGETKQSAPSSANMPAQNKADNEKLAVSEKKTGETIENVGEHLQGNRKDKAEAAKNALAQEFSDDEIATLPLSKIWPAHDVDAIEDTYVAAVAFAAREEIPSKPRVAYKVARWVQQVKTMRELAGHALRDIAVFKEKLARLDGPGGAYALRPFAVKVALLEQLERQQWKRIGNVWEHPDAYRYGANGDKVDVPQVVVEIDGSRKYFENGGTVGEAIDAIRAALEDTAENKKMEFEVRGSGNAYFINKKGDPLYRKLKTFESSKEAIAYKHNNHNDLVSAWEAIKATDNVKEQDVRPKQNRPRTAQDWRKGRDVSAEDFASTYGFRGVEFGEWVAQGKNAKDRQGMVNQAYDALMDLATIIGIPPRAISLNGTLGLGFGSRGQGWASAHFEPDTLVINLTKTRGAGTLAHEWFHALDNYFQRARGEPSGAKREDYFITYAPENYYVHKASKQRISQRDFEKMIAGESVNGRYLFSRYRDPKQWELVEGVRPEVGIAFSDLVKALNDSPMAKRASLIDKGKSGGYWSRIIERGARSFENYIIHKMMMNGYHNDYLANVVDIKDFSMDKGRYPYLLESEIAPVAEAFDNLFATIQTKETDQGVAMFSRRIHGDRPNAHDYIVPETPEFDGNMTGDLAYTPRSAEANGLEQLPIRLTVGVAREAHRGFGILHMNDNAARDVSRKPPQVTDDAAENFARQVAAVARTFQSVHHEHGNRYILVSPNVTDALVVERMTDTFTGDGFYSAVTLVPAKNRNRWGEPVWAGRAGFPVDRTLQSRASVPSPDQDAQRSDRQPQRNQTSHFDFSKVDPDRQQRQATTVTIKKRRAYTVKDADLSRSTTRRATGITQRDAEAVASVFRQVNGNAPTIIVLEDVRKAPDALLAEIKAAGAQDDVEGAYHAGSIYLFPQNIGSIERAAEVLAHEGRHFAFAATKGKALDSILLDIYNTNDRVRRLADAKKAKLGIKSVTEATEEALADLDVNTLQGLKGWRKLATYIRLRLRGLVIALRRHGYTEAANWLQDKVSGWTDADVAAMLTNADKFVRSGRGHGVGDTRLQRVWNSKPFDGPEVGETPIGDTKTVTVDGKERTVFNSDGKPIHHTVEGVRNFYRWFGESAVVDDQGRPMVVYHGTASEFTEFKYSEIGKTYGQNDQGFFFTTDRDEADYVAHDAMNDEEGRTKKIILELYLSVLDPLVTDHTEYQWNSWEKAQAANIIDGNSDRLFSRAESEGNDGIIAVGDDGEKNVVVFDPTQIKSATGNIGTFSSADANILFSRAVSGKADPDAMLERNGEKLDAMREAETRFSRSNNAEAHKYVYEIRDNAGKYIGKRELSSAEARSMKDAGYLLIFDGTKDRMARFSRSQKHTFGDLNQAQEQALRNTGGIVEPRTIKQWFDEQKDNWQAKMAQGIADQFAPLKDLDWNAYLLARMSKASDGAFEALLRYGNLNLKDGVTDTDATGKGFIESLQMLQGEQERFFWWIAANRAESLDAVGKENLFGKADIAALKTLNLGKMPDGQQRAKVYREMMAEYTKLSKNVLDIAEQSGIIDGDSRKTWEKEMYVPFYRAMEDGITGPNIGRGPGLVRQYAFKKLKGGKAKLNHDLLANVMLNWAHLLNASAKNRGAEASLKAAEKKKFAAKLTGERKGAVFYLGRETKKIPKGQAYTEDGVEKVSDGTAEISVHGKIWYQVDDPMLMDAISALEFTGFGGPAMAVMSKFKHYLTIGVTANPTFKIRNLIRDSVSALAMGDLSYNPGKNLKQGVAALKDKRNQAYASMLAGGGLIRFGAMIDGNRSTHVQRLVNAGVKRNTIIDTHEHALDFMRKLWDGYNELGDISEGANRAALYEQLRAKGMSHAEASFQARDLLDFSMGGTWNSVRILTQTVPFLNARIQGLYKLARAGKADPKRFGTVLGGVTMATIALMLAGYDDEDWKKREEWDKETYWWFKIGDVAYRIPKPFEIGAMATIAERGLEAILSDDVHGKDFAKSLGFAINQTLAFNPVPQLFKPIIDVYANKDSFTGRDIETFGMENKEKSERYNARTSELGKLIGAAGNYTGISPVQADFLMKGYFAWLSVMANTIINESTRLVAGGPARPEWTLRETFLAGNFVETLPSGSSKYVTHFYDQAKEIEQAWATYRAKRQSGDIEGAAEYMDDNRNLIRHRGQVSSSKRQLSEIRKRIEMIENNKIMSSSEKRKMIDSLNARRDKLTRDAVSRMTQ